MSEWTERAIREVEAREGNVRGTLRPDGSVNWKSLWSATGMTGFLTNTERQRLAIALQIEENRLTVQATQVAEGQWPELDHAPEDELAITRQGVQQRAQSLWEQEQRRRDRPAPPTPSGPPPAPQTPPPEAPTLPRMVRGVTEGGAVRYHPAPDGHEGEAFYQRRTAYGVGYLDEKQYAQWQAQRTEEGGGEAAEDENEGDEEAPAGQRTRRAAAGRRRGVPAWLSGVGTRRMMAGRVQGMAVGAMAAGLTGAAVGGLTNPLHQMVGTALQSGGGTGAGMTQIANGLTTTLATGLQLAAHTGGALIGGALGLVLGAGLGAVVGSFAGMLGSTLGTAFGQLGQLAGQTLGGVVGIFRDATKEALALADAVMKIAANSNMSKQSAANLVTGAGALGMNPQQAEGLMGGQQEWQMEMRLNAFGVRLQRNADGSLAAMKTYQAAAAALQQYDPMIQPMVAKQMLGEQGGSQLLTYMKNPGMLDQARQAEEELSPRAGELQRQWEALTVPLNRVNLMWREIKVEFVSAFLPTMMTGVNFLRGLWAQYGQGVIAWLHELPTMAAAGLQRIGSWFSEMWNTWKPRLDRFWEGFKAGLDSIVGVANSLLGALGAVTGIKFPTIPGIPGARQAGYQASQHPFAEVAGAGGGIVQRVAQFAQDHPTATRVVGGGLLANLLTGGLLGRAAWGGGRMAVQAMRGARAARTAATVAETAGGGGGLLARMFGGGRGAAAARATTAARGALAASAAERAATGGGMFAEGWGTYARTAARGTRALPWAARVGLPRALGTIAAPLAAITTGLEGYSEGRRGRVTAGGLLGAAGGGALTGGMIGGVPGAIIGAIGGMASYGIGQWLGRRRRSADQLGEAAPGFQDRWQADRERLAVGRAAPPRTRWDEFFRNMQNTWRQAQQQTREDLQRDRQDNKVTLEVQAKPNPEYFAQLAAKEIGENVRVIFAGVT